LEDGYIGKGGFLSSRWGALAAQLCWGGVAGTVLGWLTPPTIPRCLMSVAAADNPLTGSPWENAAIVPSTGDGQDATIEAAGFAAAGAGSASHSTI